jgi:hypothetical protein
MRFFSARLCRARAECLAYLASFSSGASAFFVPKQAGLLIELLKFDHNVSGHMAQRKNDKHFNSKVKGSSPISNRFLKSFFASSKRRPLPPTPFKT